MAKQSALDALQLEVQGKKEHAGFRRRQAGERQHYGSHEFCYHQRQQRQAEAETQSYVANELLGYYPRTELDSLLTATLTQYWTSGRTQTEIDDAVAGLLDQATADARYLVRPNLLLRSPLTGANVLGNLSTLEINCDCWSTSEADSRYISTSDLSPLDARYFVREPFPEGNGIFSMVQEQFTLRVSRSLLPRTVGAGHTGQLQHARTRVRLLEQGDGLIKVDILKLLIDLRLDLRGGMNPEAQHLQPTSSAGVNGTVAMLSSAARVSNELGDVVLFKRTPLGPGRAQPPVQEMPHTQT
ncbi:hypothetical protein AK812_SmicGene12813 [Symbiodinium microadriaticum]|uniref:Uncharacterized protein n=1 Tax=Symbiodinium microadriaticum TaxID=2951 RepID=A0A1Q9E9R6_SYMMI|nr:hypothetical protein AK812_SmicGene12813 [Symbiodinium microadriaticum]